MVSRWNEIQSMENDRPLFEYAVAQSSFYPNISTDFHPPKSISAGYGW